jgi:hypothetical protein
MDLELFFLSFLQCSFHRKKVVFIIIFALGSESISGSGFRFPIAYMVNPNLFSF